MAECDAVLEISGAKGVSGYKRIIIRIVPKLKKQ